MRTLASRTTAKASGSSAVQALAALGALFEFVGLGLQLLITERLQGRFEFVDLLHQSAQLLHHTLVAAAKKLRNYGVQHNILVVSIRVR